jgi:uncharacterized repeat protein (TIGR01451 family)
MMESQFQYSIKSQNKMMFPRFMLTLFGVFLLFFSGQVLAWKMEADNITVKNTAGNVITHINFRQTYSSPPLVFTLATSDGSETSSLRVNNITTTGFDVYSVEPQGDGVHIQMTPVPYIAIEAGSHVLPDGTKIVAGSVSTQQFQSKLLAGSSWHSIALSGFSTTPTVLGQIQTRVNERTDLAVPSAVSQPWITTKINNVTSSGFNIALERSETTTGTLTSNETIAYLAIDSGLNGANHYFAANNATKIEYESIRTNVIIVGWQDSSTGVVVNFSKAYPNPIAVSTMNTRYGVDGGWLRRRSISGSNMALVVDEDKASDSERHHTAERVGILLFSQPFDAEFIYSGQAQMMLNEVMYNEVSTGVSNDEFVELYVTGSGNLKGTVIADQDGFYYTFPSFNVSAGDYVIYHTGSGTNYSAGNVHHFFQGISPIWNNGGDDIVLLKPSQDVTLLTDGKAFNAIPADYIAYGSGGINPVPVSMHGVSLIWNGVDNTRLGGVAAGQSISLTPNTTDTDTSVCWEKTTSGDASACPSFIITQDTDASSLINSQGKNNTNAPEITLTKTLLTIYDPYNGASNPKAIPGSVLEYIITAKNDGPLAADNNTIKIADLIPANTKLCVANSGNCKAPYFINGSPSSGLSLAGTAYSNNNGASYAYTAVADGEGADNNVTNLRASMNGAFQPKTGATAPNFSFKFRVIVK